MDSGPRTPLFRPRAYFESNGFPLRPALAAFAAAAVAFFVAVVATTALLVGRVEDAPAFAALLPPLIGTVLLAVVGWVIAVLLVAVLADAFLGDRSRVGPALTVATWATALGALTSILGFALTASTLGATSGTSADALRTTLSGVSLGSIAIGFVVAGWQTYVYAQGFAVLYDTDTLATGALGFLVAYGGLLLGLI
ncbi:YIP1 family protein [Salarchaeum sp. III]|uniref:YIP1 family protein n=1 Tax=Salarchaeum sp. III TaxID=3107927 RepID=UPI002EDAFEFC